MAIVARLHVLGRFRFTAGDGCDATPKSAKAGALLAYLALSPEGTIDRGRIAGLLWSESADAKSSLRQCVKELRRVFRDAGLEILSADTYQLRLDLQRVWVDALKIQCLLSKPFSTMAPDAILSLYSGDLLDNVEVRDASFEEWLEVERRELQELALLWQVEGNRGGEARFAPGSW
jgi:DNA-binding SARP family transcriptional activator